MDEPLGSSVHDSNLCVLGEYNLHQRLGQGAFGSVYLAQHSRTKERYAIKEVPRPYGDEQFYDRIRHEAQIMQGLQHPHVVRFYQLLSTPDAFYFVLEVATGGELFDKIISAKRFPEGMARKYFQQLISALAYCHGQRIAHRDLKAENLLLSDDKLKVCDFGMSTITLAENDDEDFKHPAGTIAYMCPELFKDGSFSDPFRADMYAAGVILFFMLSGELPFDGPDEEEVVHRICFEPFDDFPLHGMSEAAIELISILLEKDPKKRGDMDDVLRNPWFQVDLDSSLFAPNALIKPRRESQRGFCNFQRKPSGESIDDVTEAEMSMLRKAFDSIDTDRNGDRITRDELRDCLVSLKHGAVSQSDVDRLAALFHPADGSGITFDEFKRTWIDEDLAHSPNFDQFHEIFKLSSIAALNHAPATRHQMMSLRCSFDKLDADHCGVVTETQIKEMFKKSGISASDDELGKLLSAMSSVNHNNAITFDEFVVAIAKNDILIRHPLGKRLAQAMELIHLAESAEFSELASGGTTVVGTIDEVLDCLVTHPRLTHEGMVVPGTVNASFGRRRKSSPLPAEVDAPREEVHTFEYHRDNSVPPSPNAGTPCSHSLSCYPCPDREPELEMLPPPVPLDSAPPHLFHLPSNLANSTTSTSTLEPQQSSSGLVRRSTSGGIRSMNSIVLTPSKRPNPHCVIDVQLTQASLPGYTHIKLRRIVGCTKDFHRAAYHVAQSISSKREQCLVDSAAIDDGELM